MNHQFRMFLTHFIPNTKFTIEKCIDILVTRLFTPTLQENIFGILDS
jgi:hypothetical protein